MTRNEAYKVLRAMYFGDTYLEGGNYNIGTTLEDEVDNFDFDTFINYLWTLDVPFEVVRDFVNGDIEFDTIDGKHTGDDWDYLVIYKDKSGKWGMYAWTEVLGITYDIKDYGKTWTERHETEEEIKAREEQDREWKERFDKSWAEVTETAFANIDKYLLKPEEVHIGKIGNEDKK